MKSNLCKCHFAPFVSFHTQMDFVASVLMLDELSPLSLSEEHEIGCAIKQQYTIW